MYRLAEKHLVTILVALAAGAVGAAAPVVAHGVIHAKFAHEAKVARNAKRLGGEPPPSYMRTTGRLRLVGVASINGDPGPGAGVLDKSSGVIDSAVDESTGLYSIYFKRNVRGLATGDATNDELIIQVTAEDSTGNMCSWDDFNASPPFNYIQVNCMDGDGSGNEDTDFVIMVYEPRA